MAVNAMGQVWLDRQADRIERTLSSLELPVRVNGGQVCEGRVRYHLTPVGATQTEALESAEQAVATALGAKQVRVAREVGGVALEVRSESGTQLRLLPLMHAMGQLRPLTAVLGMAAAGYPLTLSLEDSATQHLLVEGPAGSGKSELLRTLLISLALTSRPAQLQVLAVDPSSRQLTCLEALPHALTEVAVEAGFAVELLNWLAEEAHRRRAYSVNQPALLLLMDDFHRLPSEARRACAAALGQIMEAGSGSSIHVILARDRMGESLNLPFQSQALSAGPPGSFSFRSTGHQVEAEVGWLTARDLNTAVALARQYPGVIDRGRLTAILSQAG